MVVLRLTMGQNVTTNIFGEFLASWMSMAGMVFVYAGYSLGMAQVSYISTERLENMINGDNCTGLVCSIGLFCNAK